MKRARRQTALKSSARSARPPSRLRARAFLLLLLAALATGLGTSVVLASFASTTSNDGSTFSAAASFPPSAFVREVGTASCEAATSSITVPAGGIPAGHTLVVRYVARGSTTGPVTASDNRGNLYTVDVGVFNGGVRTVILSAQMSSPLRANEHVDVSYPGGSATSVVVDEFTGIAPAGRVDVTGTGVGQSSSPNATVATTNAADLLLALSGNQNVRTYADPASWTALPETTTACGGAPGNLTNHAAYRTVSTTGSYTYAPSLSQAEKWSVGVVAYKRP